MKNIVRSVPAKILCFILCIFMAVTVVGCAMGAYILVELNFYTQSKAFFIQETQYQMVRSSVDNIIFAANEPGWLNAQYAPGATNLRFLLADSTGAIVATNLDAPPDVSDDIWYYQISESDGETDYRFYAYLEEHLPVQDAYAFYAGLIRLGYALRYWVYIIGLAALILCIICYVCLLCSAGRRPRSDRFHPGLLHKVPFDLLLLALLVFFYAAINFADHYYGLGNVGEAVLFVLIALLGLCTAIGLSVTVAGRCKDRSLFKNTLIYKGFSLIFRFVKKAWQLFWTLARSIPLIWRTLLAALLLFVTDCILIVAAFDGVDGAVFLFLVKTLLVGGIMLYSALFMRKLQKGGAALAAGDLTYKTDTSIMLWDFKQHGEHLNRISDGMAAAVEERLRSERMKTELITNVSHDIKTPLTSIINYATLISETPCDSGQHSEYADVLLRKSARLRQLLDDLVEASKASTGNLDVTLAPCEANVLLTQAAGEFAQRCQDAQLTLVTAQPETPLQIMADSRRIWRVFENLMGNACKYSLPGSRVFLTLEADGNDAVFTLRNTSKTELNIRADELMERFVRGDSSRSTEGSGLGLSIAQSLTQLQGGTMKLTIDGDLFKVTLRFPTVS